MEKHIEHLIGELIPSYKDVLKNDPLPIFSSNTLKKNQHSISVVPDERNPKVSSIKQSSIRRCNYEKGIIYGGLLIKNSPIQTRSLKNKM